MEEHVKKEVLRKYIFIALVVLLVVASYFMLRPYLVAMLSAFILGFLVKPLHRFFSKRTGEKSAAFICIFILILVILVPIFAIVGTLVKEAYSYASMDSLDETLNTIVGKVGYEIDSELLNSINSKALNFFAGLLKPLISNVASFLMSLFVMLFGLYFVLTKWEELSLELSQFIPFKDKKGIVKELSDATTQIVYGTFLIGLIEFIVALGGFSLLGVGSPLLLASLIFLAAFIPAFGPGMVWIPLVLYYFVIGNYFVATCILIIGLVISFGIDFFGRSFIVKGKTKISPFLMLLGILGGVGLFGIFGIIIGPLILTYTLRILQEAVKKD